MASASDCPSSPDQHSPDIVQHVNKRRATESPTINNTVQDKNHPDNNNDVGFVLGDIDDDNTEEQDNDDVCSDFVFIFQ